MYGRRRTLIILAFFLVLSLASCVRVGKEFPTDAVTQIKIGQTTKEDIRRIFGPPWRTGYEDGEKTWTYGRYDKRVFGQSEASDLVVRFDDNDVVSSYSFSTTDIEEK